MGTISPYPTPVRDAVAHLYVSSEYTRKMSNTTTYNSMCERERERKTKRKDRKRERQRERSKRERKIED